MKLMSLTKRTAKAVANAGLFIGFFLMEHDENAPNNSQPKNKVSSGNGLDHHHDEFYYNHNEWSSDS